MGKKKPGAWPGKMCGMNKIKQWLNWWIDETAITARIAKNQGRPLRDTAKTLAVWGYLSALAVLLFVWLADGRFKAAYWAGMVIAGSLLVWLMFCTAILLGPLERVWERRKNKKPGTQPGSEV